MGQVMQGRVGVAMTVDFTLRAMKSHGEIGRHFSDGIGWRQGKSGNQKGSESAPTGQISSPLRFSSFPSIKWDP